MAFFLCYFENYLHTGSELLFPAFILFPASSICVCFFMSIILTYRPKSISIFLPINERPRGKLRGITERNPQELRSKLRGILIPRKRDKSERFRIELFCISYASVKSVWNMAVLFLFLFVTFFTGSWMMNMLSTREPMPSGVFPIDSLWEIIRFAGGSLVLLGIRPIVYSRATFRENDTMALAPETAGRVYPFRNQIVQSPRNKIDTQERKG